MKSLRTNIKVQILIFNLIPLLGVAFFNWSPFALFYAFWLETLSIAFLNAIKILFAQAQGWSYRNITQTLKFFLIQCGIIIFYLIFIVVFLGFQIDYGEEQRPFGDYLFLLVPSFRWAVLGLFFIKIFELIVYYFFNRQYENYQPNDFYYVFSSRTILIHVVIVLGFFSYSIIKTYISNYVGILVFTAVFVLGKILLELYLLPSRARSDHKQLHYI